MFLGGEEGFEGEGVVEVSDVQVTAFKGEPGTECRESGDSGCGHVMRYHNSRFGIRT